MILTVRPLRFEFEAMDPVWFPPGKAANIFRGAFGDIFRRIACEADCPGAKSCPRALECPYAQMFEPRAQADAGGPSGFLDRPRPFVLRAAALDGRRFLQGDRFTLDVNVFDRDAPALEYFRRSFAELFREGLGPGRARVELTAAEELPTEKLDLAAPQRPVRKVSVTFVTPTELKSEGQTLREPAFGPLFRRTRDRVTGLIGLYQGGQVCAEPIDFRGLGERAAEVRMTEANIRQVEYERRSGRTGQRHGLGGFTGEAVFEGELAEFLPYLEAARWTGVGRLTVWGNGFLRAVAQPAPEVL